jgi:hypothetical protein
MLTTLVPFDKSLKRMQPMPWWLQIPLIRRFALLEQRGSGNLWLYAAPRIERE